MQLARSLRAKRAGLSLSVHIEWLVSAIFYLPIGTSNGKKLSSSLSRRWTCGHQPNLAVEGQDLESGAGLHTLMNTALSIRVPASIGLRRFRPGRLN